MVCDFLGAGQAYSSNAGKIFTIDSELTWWNNTKNKGIKMHEDSIKLVDTIFDAMKENGIDTVLTDKAYLDSLKNDYEK